MAASPKPKCHLFVPGQGTRVGCRPGPCPGLEAGGLQEAACGQRTGVSLTHCCFSPSLIFSLLLSLKINKILKKCKMPAHCVMKSLRHAKTTKYNEPARTCFNNNQFTASLVSSVPSPPTHIIWKKMQGVILPVNISPEYLKYKH